ncbi:glycosyl transferase family protein [Clostridia bacterium]|nr:glycosyl transferase family protein [Clostridia bacterium]
MYSIVVPLYNEEEVILESYKRLKTVMDNVNEPYELVFVNDGSRDKTLEMARKLAENDKNLKIISFSRNFGHQIAVTAGLEHAVGEAVVVIDADLQDPPEVMPEMFAKWKEGWQVVYGQRLKRQGETLFKKATAKLFYRGLRALTEVEMPVDAGDFRLYDRAVVEAMKKMPEHNRYLRGMVSWLGFRQTSVSFTRQERFAGVTKYSLKKMINFAADGVTSFSQKPLKIGIFFGVFFCVSAVVIALLQLVFQSEIACWAAAIIFIQGIVLICGGIQGAYMARVYDEVKNRPLYVVSEKIN